MKDNEIVNVFCRYANGRCVIKRVPYFRYKDNREFIISNSALKNHKYNAGNLPAPIIEIQLIKPKPQFQTEM